MLLEAADPAFEDQAFKALGHRDRRALLRAIGPDELPVGDLATAAALDQPIASQHLKVLRTAGLVSVRSEGNRRLYSVDMARIGALRTFLDQFWNEKLLALKQVAETTSPSSREDTTP